MTDFEHLKAAYNNKAVDFLVKRLQTPEYRGHHLVQHVRYDFNAIYKILELINKYAPDQGLLPIRTRDLSKQPYDDAEWRDYSLLCNEVNSVIGKSTQDSLRKTVFVDLARLGLIDRYNKKKEWNDPYAGNVNAFVAVSVDGLKLLNMNDPLKRSFFIGRQIDIFLHNCIENLLYVLREGTLKYVDVYEYMFFMTAIDFESDFVLSRDEAVALIAEYRKLAPVQRISLVKDLQSIMVTCEGDIKGSTRKDFGNWKNEAQSLFDNFLKNLIYFQLARVSDIRIMLSSKDGLFTDEKTRLDRSQLEKQLYMDKHKVCKKDGFELHHVIPLSYSTSLEHFKLLDTWLNMVYIDAYSHRRIKRHIILEGAAEDDLLLLDTAKSEIYLKKNKNILYAVPKKQSMIDKNAELRGIQV